MKCHLKKIFSVFILLADTWYDHCKSARRSIISFAFVLKICTDTYKIIDKNIPLLTIRLGGKPCERLGRGSGWLAGGRAGQGVCGCGRWVGWAGGVEEEEEAWAVVLLGLGFFLGLLGGFLHLQEERGRDHTFNWTCWLFLVWQVQYFTGECI